MGFWKTSFVFCLALSIAACGDDTSGSTGGGDAGTDASDRDASDRDGGGDAGIVVDNAIVASFVESESALVILPGTTVDASVTCSDNGQTEGLTAEIMVDGAVTEETSLTLDETGEVLVEARCLTQDNRVSPTASRTITVATPEALYLSTEEQLDYSDVMLSTTPGAPTVLNDAIFAPGGRLFEFVVAGGDTYYVADHGLEGHKQLYRANASDPTSPTIITDAPAGAGPNELIASPTGDAFAYFSDFEVQGRRELYWVDATLTTPTAVRLSPGLVTGQNIEWAAFSNTGRYIGFSVQDTTGGSGQYDVYIADLQEGDVAQILDNELYLATPVAFASDDSVAVAGAAGTAQAVDLSTLASGTPTTVELSSGFVHELAFIETAALLALVQRPNRTGEPELHVVDPLGALIAEPFDEIVFDAHPVQEAGAARQGLHVCGDHLLFTAGSEASTFNEELYYVDLNAWVSDFLNEPGTSAPPVKVHVDLAEDEQTFSSFVVTDANCTQAAFALRHDHDDNAGTPLAITVEHTPLPATGTSQRIAVAEDLRTGGLFPDFAFSPDGNFFTWSEYNGQTVPWVSAVPSGTPVQLGGTLEGEVDEFFWLDSNRVLLYAARATDAGLYIWDRTDPNNPTRLSPRTPNVQGFKLDAENASILYIESFTTLSNQLTSIPLDDPQSDSKVNGESASNGASITRTWSIANGAFALLAAENGVNGIHKLYAVDVTTPGQMLEVFPGDGNPTGTMVASTLQHLPTQQRVVFEGSVDGVKSLFAMSTTTPAAASRLAIDESIRVVSILAVAANGSHVMFRGQQDDTNKVFVRSLGATDDTTAVFEGTTSSRRGEAFSADGRYGVFLTGNQPVQGYLVDTQDLQAGASPLLDESFPVELPSSPDDEDLRATNGITSLSFDAAGDYLYYAYDETYSRNLKVVRLELSSGTEQPLSASTEGAETIEQWSFSPESNAVVYQRRTFPDGADSSAVEIVVSIDPTAPGVERILSPSFETVDRGVITYELFGEHVVMRASESGIVEDTHYAAPIDGSEDAWRVNADLETSDHFDILGLTATDGATTVTYAGRQQGDATAQLYVASRNAASPSTPTTRARIAMGDRLTAVAQVSEDGHWLFYEPSTDGVSGGLMVRALQRPDGPALQLSAMPIANGGVSMPSAVHEP